MRITVNGARVETNIRKSIEPVVEPGKGVCERQRPQIHRAEQLHRGEPHQTPPNLHATRREWGTYHCPYIAGKVLRGGQKGGAGTRHHRYYA